MSNEKNCAVDESRGFDPCVTEQGGVWRLETDLFDELPAVSCGVVSSRTLGMAFEPEQRFENPDGTSIVFDEDYFGRHRPTAPIPGPFAEADEARRVLCQDLFQDL